MKNWKHTTRCFFYLIKDQTEQRERLEKEIERLSVVIDEKQQKIDYYEGTYFTIEAAAKERMAIIQRQQAQLEKYRKKVYFGLCGRSKAFFRRRNSIAESGFFLFIYGSRAGAV